MKKRYEELDSHEVSREIGHDTEVVWTEYDRAIELEGYIDKRVNKPSREEQLERMRANVAKAREAKKNSALRQTDVAIETRRLKARTIYRTILANYNGDNEGFLTITINKRMSYEELQEEVTSWLYGIESTLGGGDKKVGKKQVRIYGIYEATGYKQYHCHLLVKMLNGDDIKSRIEWMAKLWNRRGYAKYSIIQSEEDIINIAHYVSDYYKYEDKMKLSLKTDMDRKMYRKYEMLEFMPGNSTGTVRVNVKKAPAPKRGPYKRYTEAEESFKLKASKEVDEGIGTEYNQIKGKVEEYIQKNSNKDMLNSVCQEIEKYEHAVKGKMTVMQKLINEMNLVLLVRTKKGLASKREIRYVCKLTKDAKKADEELSALFAIEYKVIRVGLGNATLGYKIRKTLYLKPKVIYTPKTENITTRIRLKDLENKPLMLPIVTGLKVLFKEIGFISDNECVIVA